MFNSTPWPFYCVTMVVIHNLVLGTYEKSFQLVFLLYYWMLAAINQSENSLSNTTINLLRMSFNKNTLSFIQSFDFSCNPQRKKKKKTILQFIQPPFAQSYLFRYLLILLKINVSNFSSFFFFVSVAAASQNGGKHEPMFISRSETFKFKVGETINLPCDVSNAGNVLN